MGAVDFGEPSDMVGLSREATHRCSDSKGRLGLEVSFLWGKLFGLAAYIGTFFPMNRARCGFSFFPFSIRICN
jgi:hypothetical protein